MKQLYTPRRLPVLVPETDGEDVSPKFKPGDGERILEYYRDNGYVVVRGCIEPEVCDEVRSLWEREVKPFKGYMYRQATQKAEQHVLNDKGWVMNPVLNLQSVDPVSFPEFRATATRKVLANRRLAEVFKLLLGDTPKVVQSMYFEGNSATWEHQDSYYLDSEQVGTMAAAWIAIEDISADAGRFFVCPGSHKMDLIRQQRANNVADSHDAYIEQVVERIRAEQLEIRAPCLKKGDVLFWNAFTIHGSLDSQDVAHSRSSITCHAIANAHRLLQFHTRTFDLPTEEIDGTRVFRPKDLARRKNKFVFGIEKNFPGPFYALKKFVIRRVVAAKRS